MKRNLNVFGATLAALVLMAATSGVARVSTRSQTADDSTAKIVIDHNSNGEATKTFKFARVASPSGDESTGEIAPRAGLLLVDGDIDTNGAPLGALTDSVLPAGEDEPEANFFFDAGTPGGRFRMDFGSAVEISEVRTYSWHPNTRGPQLYRLYGSDGGGSTFCATPKASTDPATCGWKLIATVDTAPTKGDVGGQYGVSVTDSRGSLGQYRYLLFSCFATEMDDAFGNTFYSEVNVVKKK